MPARIPLSRERIVEAAVALADSEGLDAVSIRRIAAALEARPMSLYAHVESKEAVLFLMREHVIGANLLGEVPGDWREALGAIARRTRQTALRHPWMLSTVGAAPTFGPNALRHIEESAAAMRNLDVDEATKLALAVAVDTYTLGHVTYELAGARGAGTLADAAEGDERPRLDVGRLRSMDPEEIFERGLQWLLRGVAEDQGHVT